AHTAALAEPIAQLPVEVARHGFVIPLDTRIQREEEGVIHAKAGIDTLGYEMRIEVRGRDLLANGVSQRRYSSDPAIVGKTIVLEGESHGVVGVLPPFPMFHVLNRALDIYAPLSLPAAELSRQDHSIFIYARLRQG